MTQHLHCSLVLEFIVLTATKNNANYIHTLTPSRQSQLKCSSQFIPFEPHSITRTSLVCSGLARPGKARHLPQQTITTLNVIILIIKTIKCKEETAVTATWKSSRDTTKQKNSEPEATDDRHSHAQHSLLQSESFGHWEIEQKMCMKKANDLKTNEKLFNKNYFGFYVLLNNKHCCRVLLAAFADVLKRLLQQPLVAVRASNRRICWFKGITWQQKDLFYSLLFFAFQTIVLARQCDR